MSIQLKDILSVIDAPKPQFILECGISKSTVTVRACHCFSWMQEWHSSRIIFFKFSICTSIFTSERTKQAVTLLIVWNGQNIHSLVPLNKYSLSGHCVSYCPELWGYSRKQRRWKSLFLRSLRRNVIFWLCFLVNLRTNFHSFKSYSLCIFYMLFIFNWF